MIAIINISKGSPFGWQDHEVRINDRPIARFRHRREDGLTVCLQRAAEAVEKQKWLDLRRKLFPPPN